MQEGIITESRKQSASQRFSKLQSVTVADALFALILTAAAVMRFVELGRLPLSPTEAESAWSVWKLWQPGQAPLAAHSPAYFTLTSLLTPVLGYSDAIMRLIPAIFGLALVALPWWLRRQLGVIGALTASLMLAASPLQAVASRTAGGEVMALFAAMGILVALVRYQEAGETRWLYALGAFSGLGLITSPLFYGAAVTLALAWLLQSRLGLLTVDSGRRSRPNRGEWSRMALIAGLIFLGGGTLFLLYPPGLGATALLPARWLGQFAGQGNALDTLTPFIALGRYELLLLLPGTVAILWATLRNHPLGTLCVYWMAAAFLLPLLQRGHIENALIITLPGYLLLGAFMNAQLRNQISRSAWLSWAVAAVLILLGLLGLANLALYSRLVVHDPGQIGNLLAALLAATAVIVVLILAASLDLRAVYAGTLISLLFLLAIYSWGTGWWMSHQAANDPRERWVTVGTDDDVRLLAAVARDISRQATGTDTDLDILSSVESAVLRWYLRDFERVHFVESVPIGANNAVIITPADSEPAFGGAYKGADFALFQRAARLPANEAPDQSEMALMRWWLFHETPAPFIRERVVLWWRADLALGQVP